MKRALIPTVLAALAAVVSLPAQLPRSESRTELPRAENLEKAGLRKRWHAYLPLEGRRDSVRNLQAFDGQVAVQTASGLLAVFNAETGVSQWQFRLGEAYVGEREALASNGKTFFLGYGTHLVGLDRQTGLREWNCELPAVLTAAPAADRFHVYTGMAGGRILSAILPPPALSKKLTPAEASQIRATARASYAASPDQLVELAERAAKARMPQLIWSFSLGSIIHQPPVPTTHHVVFATTRGALYLCDKNQRIVLDEYVTAGPMSSPLARHEGVLYAGCQDHNLYAFTIEGTRFILKWRYTAGGRITAKPVVIRDEIYADVGDHGLTCINRQSGNPWWQQPQAKGFIAASKRFVFSRDGQGQLLVLDRRNGRIIATLEDAVPFTLAGANEFTDRVYLARPDGLVLCLHDIDKDHDVPLFHAQQQSKEDKGAAAGEEKLKAAEGK